MAFFSTSRFRFRAIATAIVAAVIGSAALISPARGEESPEDPQAAAAIAAIVETGWVREGEALDKAIAKHKKAGQAAPADWRVDYALALVYFQHRRFPEAQASLAAAVESAPEEYAAVESLLWLETYLRQYDVALTHMRALSEKLAEKADSPAVPVSALASPADAKPDPGAVRLAKLMGQIFGYLAGPAKELVSQESVEACRADVSDKLPRDLIEAFETGEQAIDDQFVTAEADLAVARDEDAENQAQKEEELTRIGEERDRFAKAEEERKSGEAKAQEDLERELASIDKQVPNLQQRATEVQTLAAPIQQLINEVEFRISRQLSIASSSNDQNVRNAALNEADRLRFFQRQEERRLQPLGQEARNIAGQLDRLVVLRAQHEERHQLRLVAIAKERQKAEKMAKIIDRRERDLGEGGRGSSARTRGQKAKLTALTSYVKFPLEESKLALLADLKK